jgi:hypothetical protein
MLCDGVDLLGAWRLENVAYRAAVQHAAADIPEKQGQMAGAAPRHYADLPGDYIFSHKAVKVFADIFQHIRMGKVYAFQHFGDKRFRGVDYLFHYKFAPLCRFVALRIAFAGAPVNGAS